MTTPVELTAEQIADDKVIARVRQWLDDYDAQAAEDLEDGEMAKVDAEVEFRRDDIRRLLELAARPAPSEAEPVAWQTFDHDDGKWFTFATEEEAKQVWPDRNVRRALYASPSASVMQSEGVSQFAELSVKANHLISLLDTRALFAANPDMANAKILQRLEADIAAATQCVSDLATVEGDEEGNMLPTSPVPAAAARQHAPEGDFTLRADVWQALDEYNDALRSAFQCAQRDATADVVGTSNYRLLADRLNEVLQRHHATWLEAKIAHGGNDA